jgi:hypothetical protein
VRDRDGWENFGLADFARLKQKYGVTWTILEASHPATLECPYRNAAVRVCRLP